MIYIFFDVDGVLNKESQWRSNNVIDPGCLDVFADICESLARDYHGCRLVIISTWRAGLAKDGASADAGILTEALSRKGLSIYGSTPVSNKGRQAEVEYYIRRNGVGDYIVIDDDISMFEAPEKLSLYVPDYRTGLVAGDVKKILRYLKGR